VVKNTYVFLTKKQKKEKEDKFKSLRELSDKDRKEIYDFAMKRSREGW